MNAPMRREPALISGITVDPTLANCTPVDKKFLAAGNILLPIGTDITTITVFASHDGGLNWGYAQVGGTNMTFTVSGDVTYPVLCALPDDILKYSLVKFVAQAGATPATAQTCELTS